MNAAEFPTPALDVESASPEKLTRRIGDSVAITTTNFGQNGVGDEAFRPELGPSNAAASQQSLADD